MALRFGLGMAFMPCSIGIVIGALREMEMVLALKSTTVPGPLSRYSRPNLILRILEYDMCQMIFLALNTPGDGVGLGMEMEMGMWTAPAMR